MNKKQLIKDLQAKADRLEINLKHAPEVVPQCRRQYSYVTRGSGSQWKFDIWDRTYDVVYIRGDFYFDTKSAAELAAKAAIDRLLIPLKAAADAYKAYP